MAIEFRNGAIAVAILLLSCPAWCGAALAEAGAPAAAPATKPSAKPAAPAAPSPTLAPHPVAPPTSPPAAPAASFPGGALSLRETHDDWVLKCGLDQTRNAKTCVVSQEQADAKTRQHLLTMQVQPGAPISEGALVLPFGLLLEAGVALRIDQAASSGSGTSGPWTLTLRVRTCLPIGCVVPISLDARTLAAIRSAKALVITARAAETGQDANFTVSPKGFGSAFDRAVTLMR